MAEPACRQAGGIQMFDVMFAVYILQSIKTGEFYKGLTANLDNRLNEHFNGKSYSTKSMLPLRLIHVEFCSTRIEARILEKYLKSGFGREIIAEIAKGLDN